MWEYKKITMSSLFAGIPMKDLEELGKQKWELVAALAVSNHSTYYFKRRLPVLLCINA